VLRQLAGELESLDAVAWADARETPARTNRRSTATRSPCTGSSSDAGVFSALVATPAHGLFIGDYLQIDLNAGRVYIHYNANLRHVPLVGEGLPIPQQDNYLAVRDE
jgi:hypothetical protein